MRVRHRVYVHTFSDVAEKLKRHYPDPELQENQTDEQQKQHNGDFSVAASATESLTLGDLSSVVGLYLEVDAACQVRLNGTTDSLALTPMKGAALTNAKFFIEAPITQVELENPSATTAVTGTYAIWGDPTP